MSSFQGFCLSLRIIGAWTFVTGMEMLGSAYNVAHGHSGGGFDAWAYINQAVLHVAVAALLVGLAPTFARIVYRQKSEATPLATETHAGTE